MGLSTSSEVGFVGVERVFGEVPVDGEQVLVACKVIRDTVSPTTHRFVFVEVRGPTGSTVGVQSIPCRPIARLPVAGAGTVDRDSDLSIWMAGASAPLTGRCDNSRIEDGRVSTRDGRTGFAFRISDGQAPCQTSGCLPGDRIVGQTRSEERRLVLAWTAEWTR